MRCAQNTLGAAAFAAFCLWSNSPGALAIAQTNVAVIMDDADRQATPRDNRLSKRLMQALKLEIHARGHSVRDETELSSSLGFETRKPLPPDAELAIAARTLKLDKIVVVVLYSSVKMHPMTGLMIPNVRLAARVLKVSTSRSLGSIEIADIDLSPLPRTCTAPDCILEAIGGEAPAIAGRFGGAMAPSLMPAPGSSPPR